MPRFGVSITKSTSFRGGVQEFSNVYYYESISLPTESEATTIINNLKALESTFHSSAVTFTRGRLWSQGGSPSTNNMIRQQNLTGTGSTSPTTSMDKERAYLFRLRAGNDSRGNPVYLRKWYHSCGVFTTAAGAPAASILENTAGWNTTQRDSMVTAMQAIGDANGSPTVPKLCSKGGRLPDAGATWTAHQFLEHHQLGDMWRGT